MFWKRKLKKKEIWPVSYTNYGIAYLDKDRWDSEAFFKWVVSKHKLGK